MVFPGIIQATLFEDEERQDDHVDVEITRAYLEAPFALATEDTFLGKVERMSRYFLSRTAFCELCSEWRDDEGEERAARRTKRGTHDVAVTFGILPAILFVVVAQEEPRTVTKKVT